jgi:hypothetical protein
VGADGLEERPHEPQTRLLHHSAGTEVHRHRLRIHAFGAQLGEGFVDERA